MQPVTTKLLTPAALALWITSALSCSEQVGSQQLRMQAHRVSDALGLFMLPHGQLMLWCCLCEGQ